MMKSFFSPGFSSACCLVSSSLFFSPHCHLSLFHRPHTFRSPPFFSSQLCFVYIQPSPSFSARFPPCFLPILPAGALPALDINQMDLLVMLDKRRNIFLEPLINRLCRILDKSMLMNVFLFSPCLSLDPPASLWFSPQCVPPSGEMCSPCAPRQTLTAHLVYMCNACMP